jgi:hypothetical protein
VQHVIRKLDRAPGVFVQERRDLVAGEPDIQAALFSIRRTGRARGGLKVQLQISAQPHGKFYYFCRIIIFFHDFPLARARSA